MTGMEAWHLVAPLIAAHRDAQHVKGGPELNVLDEAYIIVFGALKEHDENREQEEKKNGIHIKDRKKDGR